MIAHGLEVDLNSKTVGIHNCLSNILSTYLWSYISVKIQFSNLECKHAIRNAECQSMNPEMSFREVRIQSGNAESIP